MSFKPYRDESRKNWGTSGPGTLNIQQIQTGALLRIADASESMAREYNRLLDEARVQRRRAENLDRQNDTLRRRVAALKGVITKMKAKEARND